MSRTKAVRIRDRVVWVWDNAHDVVLARMVEAADNAIDGATLDDWRVSASVGDIALRIEKPSAAETATLLEVLSRARAAIEQHGDIVARDLTAWSVLDGSMVSGGFLREPLPVDALLDVVDAFAALVRGTFEADPAGAWWLLGRPAGRASLPKH